MFHILIPGQTENVAQTWSTHRIVITFLSTDLLLLPASALTRDRAEMWGHLHTLH